MAGESGAADQNAYAGVWLGDRYLLKDLRAQGGLCAVYRGEDTVLRRPVAVKVVPARWASAYRAALRATATLAHPAAITPFDALEQGDLLFLAQEYLVAQPLGGYLREGAPVRRALDLTAQIARALAYAHQREILHGDLTPAAVLVDKRATARINNFGLPPDDAYFVAMALAVARSEQTAAPSPQPPPAPEAASEDAPPNANGAQATPLLAPWGRGEPAGDIWAAGLLLWLLITVPLVEDASEIPDAANTPDVTSSATQAALGLAGPRAFRPEVPQDVRALVRRCILPTHAQRIANADTLVVAIDDLAQRLDRERPQAAAPTPRALLAAHAAARREAERASRAALASLRSPWSPDAPTDPLPFESFDAGATRAATDFAASNIVVGNVPASPALRPASPASLPPGGPRLRLPSRPIPDDDDYPTSERRRHSPFSAPTAPDRPDWAASAYDAYARSGLRAGDEFEEIGPGQAAGGRRPGAAPTPYAPYQPYAASYAADGRATGRRGLGLAAWLLIGLLVFVVCFALGYLLPPLTGLFH